MMTTLKSSRKHFQTLFRPDRTMTIPSGWHVSNNADTAEFSRFKSQLKRAVDSVEAPQYLIDAIKTAIRS